MDEIKQLVNNCYKINRLYAVQNEIDTGGQILRMRRCRRERHIISVSTGDKFK